MSHPPLTYLLLSRAVSGGAAAIRARTRLQPAGGPGAKVFPPPPSAIRSGAPFPMDVSTRPGTPSRRAGSMGKAYSACCSIR
jgi:hypothetical protein